MAQLGSERRTLLYNGLTEADLLHRCMEWQHNRYRSWNQLLTWTGAIASASAFCTLLGEAPPLASKIVAALAAVATTVNAAFGLKEVAEATAKLMAEAILLESDYEFAWANHEDDSKDVENESKHLHKRLGDLRKSGVKYMPSDEVRKKLDAKIKEVRAVQDET